ncbi:hypothetical protein RHMOL_Rhmol09G0027100 [Rhododendron molle]|uniref:Uncharacterized protein n=1 Tax=Rhododendron molle TaxID=49168 RepID=A0ACC0MA74_RHOML|nr:hypothetical protein RHMOL_Rhmol09G0027100 [Rhododendron molle]
MNVQYMLMYDRYSDLAASISIHMYQGYINALLIWVLQKATGSVRDGSDLVFIVIDGLVTWSSNKYPQFSNLEWNSAQFCLPYRSSSQGGNLWTLCRLLLNLQIQMKGTHCHVLIPSFMVDDDGKYHRCRFCGNELESTDQISFVALRWKLQKTGQPDSNVMLGERHYRFCCFDRGLDKLTNSAFCKRKIQPGMKSMNS